MSCVFCQVKTEQPSKTLEAYLAKLPKNNEVVKSLVEAIEKGNDRVKIYSIKALGNIKEAGAFDIFMDFVGYGINSKLINKPAYQNYDWEIRMEAAMALAQLGDTNAVPKLQSILRQEQNTMVQKAIIYALGELKAKEAVPILTDLLQITKEETLVIECVKALGKIGDKSAFLPLLTVSTGNHLPVTKAEAIKSLESINWNTAEKK